MDESSVCAFGKTLSKEDFGKICRCCLSANPLASIFEVLYEETSLVDILNSLFSIQLSPEDELPIKICESCISEVILCYGFKKRFETSETALLKIITIKAEDVELVIKSEPPKDNPEEVEESQLEKSIANSEDNEAEKNLEQKAKVTKQKRTRIFTCSCEKTFTSKLEFHQHRLLTKHDFARDHQCKICGKLFSKDGLHIHMKTHEVEKRYHCDHCEKRFVTNRYLQIHLRIHTGERPYVCEFCDKSFTQTNSLTAHRRIHTGEKPFLCPLCGKSFAKKSTCDVHMRLHNKQKPRPSKKFVCETCGRPCQSQVAYKLHLYKHGSSDRQINEDGQKQCKVCNKLFASGASLYCHMKTHNEKRFLCNECGKKFRSKTSLESHYLVHTGEKSFTCEFCDKKFARQVTLQYHLNVHTGEKPYACHLCPKKFTQAGSLGLHLKIHTGERPFVCQFCDKAFGRKNVLEAHIRTHTKEKPFKCGECRDMFSDSRSLRTHKERKHQKH